MNTSRKSSRNSWLELNDSRPSATSRVSALTEISMFTEGEDIALADVFTNIWNYTGGKEAISHKESAEKIVEEFAKVLPEYDRERVHVSDMKKCFAWYNILVGAGFTEFLIPTNQLITTLLQRLRCCLMPT